MKTFLQRYLLFLIFMVPLLANGATFTVTNTGDNLGLDPAAFAGTGTLRQAIIDANATPGSDTINFNIPGTAPFTIQLEADLPAFWNFADPSLGGEVILDGSTQPGYSAGKPVVIIDGNSRAYQGIQFWGGSHGTVKGLIIVNCRFHGIKIDNNVGNVIIQGNYIGINYNNTAAGNGEHGVMALTNADNNIIGGSSLQERNIISGNLIDGIHLFSSANNTIVGNYIGTDTSGTTAIPNGANGVFILNSTNNTIGSTNMGERNLISGNTKNGISFTNTTSSTIENNYIGTTISGLTALGNGRQATISLGHEVADNHGIMLNNSANNFIINNVVSGNGTSFGTLPSPDFFNPNFTGNGNGINIASSPNVTVKGNIVGLSANLTTIIRNNQNGVIVVNGSDNCIIGGPSMSERNYIGGQPFHGIVISASEGVSIRGNYIGTGPNETENFGNSDSGIIIQNSNSGTIGGSGSNEGNMLANSKEEHGIYILESNNLHIKGNYIGVSKSGTALPNQQNGIMIQSNANNNIIGGANTDEKNVIAYNKANGINIADASAFDNSIHRNSIYCNTLRGIELNSAGNKFASFPTPVISPSSTDTQLTGTASPNAIIEIFGTGASCATCSGNFGGKNVQGKNYIGSTTTDASGIWTYSFPSEFNIDTITVTASELLAESTIAHNTSEFSSCQSCTAPTPVISGTVTVCSGTSGLVYAVANNAGSTYTWTVPSNFTIIDGQGTHSITVDIDEEASSGTISVSETSNGCSGTHSLDVTVHPRAITPDITGSKEICKGAIGLTFSVPNTLGSTYNWIVPTGAIIASGHNSNEITVNFPDEATSGVISVTETPATGCADLTPSTFAINITSNPAIAITGNTNVCANSNNHIYSVDYNTGSTYVWSVSTGVTIVSGQNSNSIVVSFDNSITEKTISVTESFASGCDATASVLITVNQIPAITTVTGPDDVCRFQQNTTYSIANPDPDAIYNWTLPGDMVLVSGQGTSSIEVDIKALGGNISVTATKNGCTSAIKTKGVRANSIPSKPIISGPDVICKTTSGIIYSVQPESNITYTWTVPTGAIIASGQGTNSISVDFPEAATSGDITVIKSSEAGCTSDTLKTIQVNPSPEIVLTANQNNCADSATTLTATGANLTGATLNWYLNGNLILSGNNNTYTATQSGIYSVAAHLGTCSDSTSEGSNIYFFTPTASYSYTTPVCSSVPIHFTNQTSNAPGNPVITYLWDFDDGYTSTETNPVHEFEEGEYNVTLTASWGICQYIYTSTIKVYNKPVVSITSDTTVCSNSPVILEATPATSGTFDYEWRILGSDIIISNNNPETFTPTTTTSYIVTVINNDPVTGGGCYSLDTVTIHMGNPFVDIGPIEVCKDVKVTTSANVWGENGFTYNWSPIPSNAPIVIENANQLIATVSGTVPGTYKLVLTVNSKSCSGSDTTDITIHKLPVATATTASDTVCAGVPIDIFGSGSNSTEPYSYVWTGFDPSFIDTIFYASTTETKISTKINMPTNVYVLTVIDNNLCTAKDTLVIHSLEKQDLVIPNLITPNNDALNDHLIIKDENMIDILPGAAIEVYNRWGKKVYSSDNYDNRWGAHELSDGMYFYLLKSGCGTEEYKGWLHVLGNVHQIRTKNDVK
ncbi:MAG TPA: gliding motility-associated C-terminal domain-containing protein [Cytophagaceae bacterium]